MEQNDERTCLKVNKKGRYLNKNMDMYQQIDYRARALQGGGQDAISDLVDTIFEFNGFTKPHPELAAALKDRIIRAELSGQTISENQILQTTNWVMNKLSAPLFAQTSLIQTRVFRSICITLMPNLFSGIREDYENIDLNKLLQDQPFCDLSPIQSLGLLILIFQQKVINDFFQKIPAQWDSDYIAALQSYVPQQSESGTYRLFSRPVSPERAEMEQLIYEANLNQTTVEENLLQGLLDQLGIPR